MSDAGSVERMASPSAFTYVQLGPMIPAHAVLMRYAAAVAVILVVFAARAALAPLLGHQAPLLPFLLGVLVCAYLGGRGPAILGSALTPVIATLWFTSWPHDAPPFEWVAHVTFFLLLALLSTFIMDALQKAVRRADEHAREAQAAARALRENDRRKDEFLAMLAHELRNPLTPIRNVAHVLGRAPPELATIKRASEMLERQASHLTHLVDDLLDVARITHRRIELNCQVISIEDVVATSLETVQPTLEARRQIVTLNVTTPHVHVNGDVVRLCQVVANLLTNASKYSAEGKPIHVSVGGDAAVAILSVRDEGMGIDAQLMPRLFDLFMQGDRSLDRAQGGLGIGLTIVKHLVEMHGGEVEASSPGLGKGSEFRIRLPRATAYLSGRPVDSLPPEMHVRRRRVLVVEDNLDAAESLRDLLLLDDHEVKVVHSGTEALSALDDFPAEVVLLDVGLPRMDGYMVAHAIRARFPSGSPRPRIVALTGYGADEDRMAAIRSGFDHHLTKPVDPSGLLRLVSERHTASMVRAT
jgi:signal transduction histidine kinase/ActR/RegA family two-component response regulator